MTIRVDKSEEFVKSGRKLISEYPSRPSSEKKEGKSEKERYIICKVLIKWQPYRKNLSI